jgi:hypothetical protein
MDRVQQEHAILNAWLDNGIDNGVFYGKDEAEEFARDLQAVDISVLNSLYSFWVKGSYTFVNTAIKSCTCGAKHTSNPKFHLSYCELDKK